MTGVPDAGSTRSLLAGPSVLRVFALALVGRLAYGLLPLCFLFTVRDATGSLAAAATAAATLGLASLAMPVQARLVDRFGQRRVLPVFAACHTSVLVLSAGLATHATAPAAWLALALLLGLAGPALGPAMRAQWREIAAEGPLRRRAYSLDSIAEESLYLVGPIVAAGILTAGPPRAGLLVAALLVPCGTAGLATSPYLPRPSASTPSAASRSSRGGPLGNPVLLGVLGGLALFGGGGAAVLVGVVSLADAAHDPGLAGLVEAAMAVGAVVGGVLWSRWGHPTPTTRVLAGLLVCVATAQALTCLVVPHLVLVAAVLAVGALATSPVFVVAFSVADAAVDAEQRTEASTWVTVGANAGTTAGTALAGLTLAAGDVAPFLLAGALTATAAVVARSVARVR